jgi:hypothetical protein
MRAVGGSDLESGKLIILLYPVISTGTVACHSFISRTVKQTGTRIE